MSYALTLYQGSLEAVAEGIRAPKKPTAARLLTAWKGIYAGSPGEDLEATLHEALGMVAARMKLPPAMGPLKVEAAIVAMIEATTTKLGPLEHSSSGGEQFREEFLGETMAEILGAPGFERTMTNRPLFGYRAKDYPSWGFLRQEELAKLAIPTDATGLVFDPDQRPWLEDLLVMLGKARSSGLDLLTVYL